MTDAIEAARVCPTREGGHVIGRVDVVLYEPGFTRIRYWCTSCEAHGTMALYSNGLNWNETAFGITAKW